MTLEKLLSKNLNKNYLHELNVDWKNKQKKEKS
jgi:hypothetical protein